MKKCQRIRKGWTCCDVLEVGARGDQVSILRGEMGRLEKVVAKTILTFNVHGASGGISKGSEIGDGVVAYPSQVRWLPVMQVNYLDQLTISTIALRALVPSCWC